MWVSKITSFRDLGLQHIPMNDQRPASGGRTHPAANIHLRTRPARLFRPSAEIACGTAEVARLYTWFVRVTVRGGG